MIKLKVIKINDSLGVILPKQVLKRLRVASGDNVFIAEIPEGFGITSHNCTRESQMKTARKIMQRRSPVLRALAK